MHSKYITGKIIVGGCITMDAAFVFSSMLGHAEMARRLNMVKVVSAGFVQITSKNNKVFIGCYGESTSLKLESKPEDAELIAQSLHLSDSEWTSGS